MQPLKAFNSLLKPFKNLIFSTVADSVVLVRRFSDNDQSGDDPVQGESCCWK
jgi:hypothetical protein